MAALLQAVYCHRAAEHRDCGRPQRAIGAENCKNRTFRVFRLIPTLFCARLGPAAVHRHRGVLNTSLKHGGSVAGSVAPPRR
jgi:hypothetical protein